MLRERNLAWMPALRGELDRGGVIVLVGAAHIPGAFSKCCINDVVEFQKILIGPRIFQLCPAKLALIRVNLLRKFAWPDCAMVTIREILNES
jgi:hypothetical protein